MALAKQISCFWPTLRLEPPLSIRASSPACVFWNVSLSWTCETRSLVKVKLRRTVSFADLQCPRFPTSPDRSARRTGLNYDAASQQTLLVLAISGSKRYLIWPVLEQSEGILPVWWLSCSSDRWGSSLWCSDRRLWWGRLARPFEINSERWWIFQRLFGRQHQSFRFRLF